MDGFLRHIAACSNWVQPGGRLGLYLGATPGTTPAGWVQPALAEVMRDLPGVTVAADRVALADPNDLPAVARALAGRNLFRWRGEAFDVRSTPDGPVLTQVDRGALPKLGLLAVGVHVNGLVRRPDGVHLWVGRRAADKLLDPGKLDHVVAGGVAAGMTVAETLVKEAGEEASIPPALAASARPAGRIGYAMARPEGLRRDLLHCYDLDLPDGFQPHPADGEVAGFELWPLARAYDAVRDGDAFKFNVNLVLIDLFLRLDMIRGRDAARVRTALSGGG